MKKCLISGSFDPITKGHEEIIKRAMRMFDKVCVCIFENPEKKYAFSLEKRLEFIKTLYGDCDKIEIASHCGLLVDFLSENEIDVVIRGIRNATDFEYEMAMEQVNKALNPQFECLYLTPSPELACVSSSIVRQLLKFGGDISFAVPKAIESDIMNEYNKTK